MTHAMMLSFRKEVSLIEISANQATLASPWGKVPLERLSAGLFDALRLLASGGATESDIVDLVLNTDGALALASMYCHLQCCSRLALLCHTLVSEGRPVMTLVPMSGNFRYTPRDVGEGNRFLLSRFAYCRRDGSALVLESPLSLVRTIVHEQLGAAVFGELTKPRTYLDLCARIDNLPEALAQAVLDLLANANVIAEVSGEDALPEDENLTLVQWSFHDLLFHARSRYGEHDQPIGGTFPFLGQIPPLPAVKPKMSDDIVTLYRPDIERLEESDPPLACVLENRRSVRAYGNRPITARQLGEFLYRVARVRQLVEPDPARSLHYQSSNRPYPSGGAVFDLELYIIIGSCTGIDPGIYHYDPLDHQLCRLAERSAHRAALLRDARFSAALPCEPQVLIVLASRFQRVSWKYSGIAYALTLKNVGVLYQTMYLVATAMGLAPCGLGAGNSVLFAEAVGTDHLAESSVGELLLGSAPEAGDAPQRAR